MPHRQHITLTDHENSIAVTDCRAATLDPVILLLDLTGTDRCSLMELTKKKTSRSCSCWLLNIFRSGKHHATDSTTLWERSEHHPIRPEIPAQSFSLFLNLPRELRDRVYEMYLLVPLPARPNSHPEAIQRSLGVLTFSPQFTSWSPHCVRCPSVPPQLTSLPMLLCNRQINAEVKGATARLEKHPGLHYILDCEIIGERYIYPTWLLLPVFTKHVPFVYVNFRSTGLVYPSDHRGWLRNAGPPGMIWALLDILQQFSAHGPQFAATSPKRKDVFIDTLVLDVLSCGNNLNNDDCAGCGQEPIARPIEMDKMARSQRQMSSRQVDSKDPAVVDALLKYMNWMFIDGEDTTPYAKIVARAVRKIYLLRDGVEVNAWDTRLYEQQR